MAAYFSHPIGDGGPPNLVVAQANHLTIFAIRREAARPGQSEQGSSGAGTEDGNYEPSLEVVAEFDLHGGAAVQARLYSLKAD